MSSPTGVSVTVSTTLATTTLTAGLIDGSGNVGTAGQILSSTATGTQWVDFDPGQLIDQDSDTQVQVEEGSDDDTIRLDAAGVEVASFTSTQTNLNTAITASSTLAVSGNATVTGDFEVEGSTTLATTTLGGVLQDYEGDNGTVGQVLSSTGTSTNWVNANTVALRTVTGDTTLTATDGTVVLRATTTAAVTLTLPVASTLAAGSYFILKRLNNGATPSSVTIAAGNATDTIDGNTNTTATTLAGNAAKMTVQTDGVSAWYIVSE